MRAVDGDGSSDGAQSVVSDPTTGARRRGDGGATHEGTAIADSRSVWQRSGASSLRAVALEAGEDDDLGRELDVGRFRARNLAVPGPLSIAIADTSKLFWLGLTGFLHWGAVGVWSVFEDFPRWAYLLWPLGFIALVMVCFENCPIRWY